MKLSALAAAGLLFAGSLASAATVPLPSTLDQLIASGATVTEGNATFSNFSVAGSVAANQIHVVQTAGTGLEFQFGWSATDGSSEDTLIRYQIHIANTQITSVGLHFDGTTDSTNKSLGNAANVAETVSSLGGTVLGELTTFNAGPNFSSLNRNDASLSVTPTSDLLLSKDIQVHSVAGSDTATISLVDNTFQTSPSVVPLPPAISMALGSIVIGSIVLFRKRLVRI